MLLDRTGGKLWSNVTTCLQLGKFRKSHLEARLEEEVNRKMMYLGI